MTKKPSPQYFQVNKVGPVKGPVGMDVGLWLHFDTDQGELTLKLSHQDAIALENKLQEEDSIVPKPKKAVADTADALSQLAADLAREPESDMARQLEGYANDLRSALCRMPEDR